MSAGSQETEALALAREMVIERILGTYTSPSTPPRTRGILFDCQGLVSSLIALAIGLGVATALVILQQLGDGEPRHQALAAAAPARLVTGPRVSSSPKRAVVVRPRPPIAAVVVPHPAARRATLAVAAPRAAHREYRERLARDTLADEAGAQKITYTDGRRDEMPAVRLEGEALR